jgi:hypothetical protein
MQKAGSRKKNESDQVTPIGSPSDYRQARICMVQKNQAAFFMRT